MNKVSIRPVDIFLTPAACQTLINRFSAKRVDGERSTMPEWRLPDGSTILFDDGDECAPWILDMRIRDFRGQVRIDRGFATLEDLCAALDAIAAFVRI